MRRVSYLTTACGLLAACLLHGTARADEGKTISVSGVGTVKARPAVAQIAATVTGEGELAADAIVKFTDARRRAIEALEGLAMENLSISGDGVSITSSQAGGNAMMAMMGQNNENVTAVVSVSEKLQIRLSGIEEVAPEELVRTLTQILDVAKDAGLSLSSSTLNVFQMQFGESAAAPLVMFGVDDVEAARNEAYAKAVADARHRAERLASLAGVKLGAVRSIQETPMPRGAGGSQQSMMVQMMSAMYGLSSGDDEDDNKLAAGSAVLAEIPVQVHLSVVFEIEG